MYCEDCIYSGRCRRQEKDFYVIGCDDGNPEGLKTNADMIRGMSDRELAEFLIICSEESGGYEYINAFDGEYSLGGICESREEAVKKQLEWLNLEVAK